MLIVTDVFLTTRIRLSLGAISTHCAKPDFRKTRPAQKIDAPTENSLWVETCDRPVADIGSP